MPGLDIISKEHGCLQFQVARHLLAKRRSEYSLCLPAVRVVRHVGVGPPGRDGLGQVRDEHGALAERLPRRLPRQTPLSTVIHPSLTTLVIVLQNFLSEVA